MSRKRTKLTKAQRKLLLELPLPLAVGEYGYADAKVLVELGLATMRETRTGRRMFERST